MRTNVYDSEFHAFQLSGIQFLLPKNRIALGTSRHILVMNIFNFNPYYLLALHFL